MNDRQLDATLDAIELLYQIHVVLPLFSSTEQEYVAGDDKLLHAAQYLAEDVRKRWHPKAKVPQEIDWTKYNLKIHEV